MFHNVKHAVHLCSRSPHGERGLKYISELHALLIGQSRSPHGERGLKYHVHVIAVRQDRSLSSRRAWIEMRTWRTRPP